MITVLFYLSIASLIVNLVCLIFKNKSLPKLATISAYIGLIIGILLLLSMILNLISEGTSGYLTTSDYVETIIFSLALVITSALILKSKKH